MNIASRNEFVQALLADQDFLRGLSGKLGAGLADLVKADTITTATGFNWFDLRPVVQLLYPYKELIPLISRLPRVNGDGGTGYHWKRITGINVNTLSFGVGEGQRGARIAITEEDQQATYKTLGLESSVTFQAAWANGQLSPNNRAIATQATLRSVMIGEEQSLILGNSSLALGTTPTPTLTKDSASTSSFSSGTVYVIAVALSGFGYLNTTAYSSGAGGVPGQVTKTNADGSTNTFGGGSAKPSNEASISVSAGNNVTATVTPVAGAVAYPVNRNVAVSPVNPPLIFEPPPALVGATSQIWAAVSGGSGGVADPNWGGCNVLLSLDGTSYNEIGTINAPARQGALSASLAAFAGGNPDTSDTLAVDLTESAGALDSASAAEAASGTTLALIDDEFLSYETATLTATSQYALTNLYRGLYGSTAAAHSSGAPFARLDSAIFKYDLPAGFIGQTLYLKFQSFNTFGNAIEDISTCAVYSYTPVGSGVLGPVAQALAAGTSLDYRLATESVSESDDFGLAGDPYSTLIDMGTVTT